MKAAGDDKELQSRIKAANDALGADATEEERINAQIAVAKEAGFEVSYEDFVRLKEKYISMGEMYEISVDELEQVGGGDGPGAGASFSLVGCSGWGVTLTGGLTTKSGGGCILLGGGHNSTGCAFFGAGIKDGR